MMNHKIWKKVKNTIDEKLDSDPVNNEEYPKPKIKFYNGKINTDFYNDKIPNQGSQSICFSVFLINFGFRTGCNYYLQVFLEKCKYVIKEKKMSKHIINDIEISDKNVYFIIFFLCIKMLTGYCQKSKENLSNKARERYKNVPRKRQKAQICS